MPLISTLILGIVALGAIYVFVIHPWHLRMGSTKDEVQRSLPGDDLVSNPRFMWNHAVTIKAPAAEVWPWLVQIGNKRAGWYSWDIIHRLLGVAGCVDDDRHSANRIIPELQNLQVGDEIHMMPEDLGTPGYSVVSIEPEQALVTHIDDKVNPVSWVWVLDPIDTKTTRLITRFRQYWEPTLMNTLMFGIADELGSLVMTPKTLSGIKRRAEALARQ